MGEKSHTLELESELLLVNEFLSVGRTRRVTLRQKQGLGWGEKI